jgi:hypothetical protein
VSLAIRFRHGVDGVMAQAQGLLRSFCQLPKGTIFRRPTVTFVAARARLRAEAVMPYAELAVGALNRLLSHFKRRKTLAIATGVLGLALFLMLLLEISLRIQLAQEAREAGTDATLAVSATSPKKQFDGLLHVQLTDSALGQFSDQVSAPEGVPFFELTQTFGQASREPIPVPRLPIR